MRREPFAARRGFYPSDPAGLEAELDRWLPVDRKPRRAIAVAAPHAGYSFSGEVAGKVYASVDVPDHVVVLCPKHTPYGADLGVMTEGVWALPGADVRIDTDLARALRDACGLQEDAEAHRMEHSIEVQLPFLRRRNPAFRLVPIAVGAHRLATLKTLGTGIADVVRQFGAPVLLVASTDMSHENGAARVRKNDPPAIEKMLAIDPDGLHRTVMENGITMCGFAPTVAVMAAAKALGATRAELVGYQTSLDHGGSEDWVVGYAGVIFE
ncbi:MAG: AmmeMemoRadiSam system protein B [Myxococcota bacterium]|nr:AmmeMemoRadiSam system protein B [Myxococcota bacterium]